MVKISIPDQQKDLDKKPILGSDCDVCAPPHCAMELELPKETPQVKEAIVITKATRQSYKGRWTLTCLLGVFLLMAFQLKGFCDLKEENIRLKKELRFERIKDATLKKAVADYVPELDFLSTSYTETDIEPFNHQEDEAPAPASKWSINVGVLWTSDDISPCDMALLSKVLAHQIYHITEARSEAAPKEVEVEEFDYNDS